MYLATVVLLLPSPSDLTKSIPRNPSAFLSVIRSKALTCFTAGDLFGADVDFYEYEFHPVIYINDSIFGDIGGVALFGETRTFPLDAIYSYNASRLSKKEFLNKFPNLRVIFNAKNAF